MSDWQPDLYLQFAGERTQPSIDLVRRIDAIAPTRIIDIGCGPGNSTEVLKARWPGAEIIGLDDSEAMIDEARATYPAMNWICADASDVGAELGTFDIVFSNAALQWMPSQEMLLPKLSSMLNKGGLLAVQVPCTKYMPIHIELEKLATSTAWRKRFIDMASTYSVHTADFYYDLLCKLTTEIDLWETHYFHVMNTHSEILEWYSGSGLRPYLDCLKDDGLRTEFLEEYEDALKSAYPVQADGRILFPFTRIFFLVRSPL